MILGKALVIALAVQRNNPPVDLGIYLSGRYYLLFGILGYLLSMVLAWLLFVLDERLKIRDCIVQWSPFINQPGFKSGRVPKGEVPLHAVSAYLVCVGLFFLAMAMIGLTILNSSAPGRVVTSPVVIVSLVCILITQIYGYWSCHIQIGTLTVIVVFVALAAWNSSSVFPEADYKLRFPGLEDYYAPDKRVQLGQLNNDGYIGTIPPTPGGRPQLRDADILVEISARWREALTTVLKPTVDVVESRPKLILVAVSGGGIRSAVWTGVVLEGLEKEMPGTPGRAAFRNHIRLFTGASGGMVGATLYVGDFDRAWPDRGNPAADADDAKLGLGPVSGTLAEQSLLPTIQTAVVRDFSRNLLVPPWRTVAYDRGRALEDKWMLNARARGYGPPGTTAKELAALRDSGRRLSPFNRTFAELYKLEAQGLRPSLIYSPMLVEDSRRLLVSNLDLGSLAVAVGPVARKPEESNYRLDGLYSRSGLEFFKLFPDAHDKFEVGTAAHERDVPGHFARGEPSDRPGAPRGRCRLLRQLRS